ncbi:MAG: hypothetical protein LBQ87_03010 [Candidatus Fibromonas sp.]|jgi:hypothetical protein|nr:hypothetical protein [Candidatus Fibromonas sp.]
MATFSNNAESSASGDVLAANQGQSGSFGEKGSPELPLNPAKSIDPADEDKHVIRDCDSFAGLKA